MIRARAAGRNEGAAAEPPPLKPKETRMAKYLVGWLLGVPAVVLVILYFFFH